MSFPPNDHSQFSPETIEDLKKRGIVTFKETLYTETVPCPACTGNHPMIICPSYFLQQREAQTKLSDARKEAIRRRKLWGAADGTTKGVTLAMLITPAECNGDADMPRFDAMVYNMNQVAELSEEGRTAWEDVTVDEVFAEVFYANVSGGNEF